MNCREAERRIYLYTELSPREREEADRHIRTCPACSQIMEGATRARTFARTASQAPQSLPHAVHLTTRVMNALQENQKRKTSAFIPLFNVSYGDALRCGMAVLSLILIVTFADQYNENFRFQMRTKSYRGNTSGIELNTASFHQAFLAAREKHSSTAPFYECAVICLQTQGTVCTDCGIKFPKPSHTP